MLIHVFGYFLVLLPFIGLFYFMWKESGLRGAVHIFGIVFGILAVVAIGIYLIGF